MTALLQIKNIAKTFGATVAVDNVSLDIANGEFLALLGPSGCGKTSLLRILGGFEKPDAGQVLMDGQDITHLPPNQRPLNMLFQSYAVFPHMTVQDNVAYGLRFLRISKDEVRQRVTEALQLVQLGDLAKRMPDQLSGGQRQRVGLARCVVLRPKILLLDEPLSALDAKLRESMQIELVNLQQNLGITFIVVTHDQDEALSMATKIAVMDKGRFLQIDSPKTIYDYPASRFVANFIGRMNMFACEVSTVGDGLNISQADLGQWQMPAPNGQPATRFIGKTDIGIRPVNIVFSATQPAADEGSIIFPVTVKNTAYYGGETLLQCATPSGQIVSSIAVNRHRDDGISVTNQNGYLSCHPRDIILFSSDSI